MEFKDLEEKVGFVFNDKDLLKRAFTHRSYLNENRELNLKHNELLEFLGDAVLELVTTDHLYSEFPEKTEGDLTAYRASLVNTNTISDVATELGFNDYLLLSKGEAKDTGRARQYILANTFESFVGALYLDQGYGVAKDFISKNLIPKLDNILKEGLWMDAKSKLQEFVQETEGVTPNYQTLDERGPDHDKIFTVGLFYGNKEITRGEGKSKQEAEQEAARKVLIENSLI